MANGLNPADARQALQAFRSAIGKCEKAREKLRKGSAQRSWVERQLRAYSIAVSYVDAVVRDGPPPAQYTPAELAGASATLADLVETCGTLPEKFQDSPPQRTLAVRRLAAFRLALALIRREEEGASWTGWTK